MHDLMLHRVGGLGITPTVDEVKLTLVGGTANAVSLTIPRVLSHVLGKQYTFTVAFNNNGAATTVKINNLTTKPLYKPGTTAAPTLTAGQTITFQDSGTCFFIKILSAGNATPVKVLTGNTFGNESEAPVSGTMPNLASTTKQIINHGSPMTLAVQSDDTRMGIITMLNNTYNHYGYIDGTTVFTAQLWGLIPENIRYNRHVGQYYSYGEGHMDGTFTGDATATAAHILAGKKAGVLGEMVTGTMKEHATSVNQYTVAVSTWVNTSTGIVLYMLPEKGSYDGATAFTYFNEPNFISDNIPIGKSMFGLAGTKVEGILNAVRKNMTISATSRAMLSNELYTENKDGTIRPMYPRQGYEATASFSYQVDRDPYLLRLNDYLGVVVNYGASGATTISLVKIADAYPGYSISSSATISLGTCGTEFRLEKLSSTAFILIANIDGISARAVYFTYTDTTLTRQSTTTLATSTQTPYNFVIHAVEGYPYKVVCAYASNGTIYTNMWDINSSTYAITFGTASAIMTGTSVLSIGSVTPGFYTVWGSGKFLTVQYTLSTGVIYAIGLENNPGVDAGAAGTSPKGLLMQDGSLIFVYATGSKYYYMQVWVNQSTRATTRGAATACGSWNNTPTNVCASYLGLNRIGVCGRAFNNSTYNIIFSIFDISDPASAVAFASGTCYYGGGVFLSHKVVVSLAQRTDAPTYRLHAHAMDYRPDGMTLQAGAAGASVLVTDIT